MNLFSARREGAWTFKGAGISSFASLRLDLAQILVVVGFEIVPYFDTLLQGTDSSICHHLNLPAVSQRQRSKHFLLASLSQTRSVHGVDCLLTCKVTVAVPSCAVGAKRGPDMVV